MAGSWLAYMGVKVLTVMLGSDQQVGGLFSLSL